MVQTETPPPQRHSHHQADGGLNQRQLSLLQEVRLRGAVSVERLSQRMGVSADTVKRDVRRLTDAGLLDRFEGGVKSLTPHGNETT
jgi:DeoR/GlpR family transcriptional regulator of sugar metabolism